MTLTLSPQELRDLLDGGSIDLCPSDPPKAGPYVRPSYPEDPTLTSSPPNPTIWPAQVRTDPPVDMTPRVSCAPRGQD